MGNAPTIQQLAEKDAEFRKYLAQIRSEIEGNKLKDIDALQRIIDAFYAEGGWSYQPLFRSDLLEVQQLSRWSLDNIVKMVSGVRDAIFDDIAPPDGVVVEKHATTNAAVDQMQHLDLLAMNKAFAAVQGVLESFATQMSKQGNAITSVEQVAPGLTLFISIRSDVWDGEGFFSNDLIGQYLFVLRSFFSVEHAGDLAGFNSVLAYTDLAATFDKRIHDLAEKMRDPKTNRAAMSELMEELSYYSDQLPVIHAKIEQLRTNRIAALKANAKTAMHRRMELVD